jgi:hypothetical protein
MSMTKTPELSSDFRTSLQEAFPRTGLSRMNRQESISPAGGEDTGAGFLEQFRSTGIEVTPEELSEIRIFDEFLSSHVQPNGICDVQCMLLWSEWVRTFRRTTHRFPQLILENEFPRLVTDMYGTRIAEEGFRGNVFQGIKYIP